MFLYIYTNDISDNSIISIISNPPTNLVNYMLFFNKVTFEHVFKNISNTGMNKLFESSCWPTANIVIFLKVFDVIVVFILFEYYTKYVLQNIALSN